MEREAGEEESQRRRCDRIREWSDVTVDFEEGPGAWAKECKHSPQAEKVMKNRLSPRASRKEFDPANFMILAQ